MGASRSRCSPQALESAFPEATGRMACKAGVGQSSWRCRQPAGPRSRPELPRGRTGDPRVGFALPFPGQSPSLVGRVALSARRDPCLRQSAPPFLPQPSTPADLTERPSSRAPTPSGLRCPSESETYRPPLREMYVRPLFMPLRVTAEVCPSCRPGNWEAQKCRSTCGVTTSGQSGRRFSAGGCSLIGRGARSQNHRFWASWTAKVWGTRRSTPARRPVALADRDRFGAASCVTENQRRPITREGASTVSGPDHGRFSQP